jgi:hypothetical protein
VNRKDPTLTEKLCTMILVWLEVPHVKARSMSRDEILAMVEWDHYPVPFAVARDNGWMIHEINHPSNLKPMLADDHAVKTAKRDVPEIAKGKRISAKHAEFRKRILAKSGVATEPERRDRKVSRFAGGRKMQSRPFRKKARGGSRA